MRIGVRRTPRAAAALIGLALVLPVVAACDDKPGPTPTPTATSGPTGSPTSTPTATPSPTGSPTSTPTASPGPTGSPTSTPTATPSPTSSPEPTTGVDAYAAAVLALNPSSYWRFEEPEGSTVLTDSSSHGNDLEWVDWTGEADGLVASTPGAAGSGQALATRWGQPWLGSLIDTGDKAYAIWFKSPQNGDLSFGNVNESFNLRDGELSFANDLYGWHITIGTGLNDDAWHMLAVTDNPGGDRDHLFLDGLEVPIPDGCHQRACWPAIGVGTPSTVTFLSATHGAALDEFALFDAPPTVDQITSLYELGKDG